MCCKGRQKTKPKLTWGKSLREPRFGNRCDAARGSQTHWRGTREDFISFRSTHSPLPHSHPSLGPISSALAKSQDVPPPAKSSSHGAEEGHFFLAPTGKTLMHGVSKHSQHGSRMAGFGMITTCHMIPQGPQISQEYKPPQLQWRHPDTCQLWGTGLVFLGYGN